MDIRKPVGVYTMDDLEDIDMYTWILMVILALPLIYALVQRCIIHSYQQQSVVTSANEDTERQRLVTLNQEKMNQELERKKRKKNELKLKELNDAYLRGGFELGDGRSDNRKVMIDGKHSHDAEYDGIDVVSGDDMNNRSSNIIAQQDAEYKAAVLKDTEKYRELVVNDNISQLTSNNSDRSIHKIDTKEVNKGEGHTVSSVDSIIFPPEPSDDDNVNTIRIAIRDINGRRYTRRFMTTNTLQDIFNWASHASKIPSNDMNTVQLCSTSTFPMTIYTKQQMHTMLQDLNILGNHTMVLRRKI